MELQDLNEIVGISSLFNIREEEQPTQNMLKDYSPLFTNIMNASHNSQNLTKRNIANPRMGRVSDGEVEAEIGYNEKDGAYGKLTGKWKFGENTEKKPPQEQNKNNNEPNPQNAQN